MIHVKYCAVVCCAVGCLEQLLMSEHRQGILTVTMRVTMLRQCRSPLQAADRQVPVAMWKKRNVAARVRREYKTADEVLSEAGEAAPAAQQQTTTILDMRGPQARVVTNLEHLNVQDVRNLTLDPAVTYAEFDHLMPSSGMPSGSISSPVENTPVCSFPAQNQSGNASAREAPALGQGRHGEQARLMVVFMHDKPISRSQDCTWPGNTPP